MTQELTSTWAVAVFSRGFSEKKKDRARERGRGGDDRPCFRGGFSEKKKDRERENGGEEGMTQEFTSTWVFCDSADFLPCSHVSSLPRAAFEQAALRVEDPLPSKRCPSLHMGRRKRLFNALQKTKEELMLLKLQEHVLVLSSPQRSKYTSGSKFQQFPFTCAESFWAENLPESAKGMVALARNPSSLVAKLPAQLHLPRIFDLCLPSSSSRSGHGNLYVGGGPYTQPPVKQDLVKSLLRTQLLISPGSIAPVSSEGDGYTINVTAIKVDSAPINIKPSILKIDKDGFGGATINPLNPFTALHSEIFKPLVKEFTKRAKDMKIKKATPVAPFGACFDAKTVKGGVAGPDVLAIVLVLHGGVQWRREGANSMVKVSKDVLCLGFSDGGSYGMGAMVIGGHQIEDNLLEFDVRSSTFGFSNSLLLRNSSCSHL